MSQTVPFDIEGNSDDTNNLDVSAVNSVKCIVNCVKYLAECCTLRLGVETSASPSLELNRLH